MQKAFNFKKWIDENRHLLKPPVGNKVIWKDAEFIIMVVGGPNSRTDFHVNQSEEFFYQLEGDIVVTIQEDGNKRTMPLTFTVKFSPSENCSLTYQGWSRVFICLKVTNILY